MNDGLRKLTAIPIRTESSSGNIPPLLHEIRHALTRLIESGERSVIDMKSLPLATGELEKFLDMLGAGEVHAHLRALGHSEIRESSYSGVWIVRHLDELGETKALLIEVTRIPEILEAQREDMQEGLQRLEHMLHYERSPSAHA